MEGMVGASNGTAGIRCRCREQGKVKRSLLQNGQREYHHNTGGIVSKEFYSLAQVQTDEVWKLLEEFEDDQF
mgnify:CR=1 FL=1